MPEAVAFPAPTTVERGPAGAPLVVLLHGRGSDAADVFGLAEQLPEGLHYIAVNAPITEGGGYAWFANRGIGRPVAESLADTMAWFRQWLDAAAPSGRPVFLVGFSGGAAFAGGLLLAEPSRFAGVAILNGTLPFDAGVPTTAGRLDGAQVFLALGSQDTVIPVDLQERTWAYLTGESGATTAAARYPAGHTISQPAAEALSSWLGELTEAPS